MTKIVRVVGGVDIQVVADLAREIWTGHYLPIIGEAQVEYMLDRFQSVDAITAQLEEGAQYYLLMDRGHPVGYFATTPDQDGSAVQLSKIYVHEDRRGQGLGKKILDFVEGACGEAGIRELWLTVNRYNADAIAFYEKAGFSSAGELIQDIGNGFVMDDYKMVKLLGYSE